MIIFYHNTYEITMPRQTTGSKQHKKNIKIQTPIKQKPTYREISRDIHSGLEITSGEWMEELQSVTSYQKDQDILNYKEILEKNDFNSGILALNHIGIYNYDLEKNIRDTYTKLNSLEDTHLFCRGMYVKDGKNPVFVLYVTYLSKHYYINLLVPRGVRPILLKKQINRHDYGEIIMLKNIVKIPAKAYIYTEKSNVCTKCGVKRGQVHYPSC